MNSPSRLYPLCGLSFAGKSTLAKRLAEPLHARIVECDQFISVVRPNTLSKLEEWRQIQTLARAQAKTLLEAGENVIYDDLLVHPRVREELKEFAAECNAPILFLYLATSADLVRQRQQNLRPTQEQQALWDQHTELLLSQLVPPAQEEAVYIEPGYVFEEVLAEIQSRIQEL